MGVYFEPSLIRASYGLLFSGKIDEAIKLFELNLKEFPESWNGYDSLGEAYLKKGDKKRALDNYRRSVELNPDNGNAGHPPV